MSQRRLEEIQTFCEKFKKEQVAFHEPNPLTPSLSPSGGEGARRAGEGDSAWFMVPMRGKKTVLAFHESQRAAGILPAEEAWICRRDVGSTLLRRSVFLRKFMVSILPAVN